MIRVRGTAGDERSGPNLLDFTPRREVRWEEREDGLVTLVREKPVVRDLRSFRRWWSFMMAPPRIRLDEVGSFAWLNMDGDVDVRELAQRVRNEFGESAEPVAQRLGQFVRLLKRERFVTYVELDD